jgi:hypothetical protein
VTTPAYSCPDDVAAVDDGDRTVLLHLPTGQRLVLSPTASALWRGLADGEDPGSLCQRLAGEYGADVTVIAADQQRLVADLLGRGLLTTRLPASGT